MVVLASHSPTRAGILRDAKIAFIQRGCDFDEDALSYSSPDDFVYHATVGKMDRYLELYNLDIPVVAADTVVTCNGIILRKATTKEDARRILRLQSGNTVSILTCMVFRSHTKELIDLSCTDYLFDPFDEKALETYLEGSDWVGKAGACMVEGFCKDYIREVRGYESTAMGLCVEKLLPFLDRECMPKN